MSLKKRLSVRGKRRAISLPLKVDELANLPAPRDDSCRQSSQPQQQAPIAGIPPGTLSEGMWAASILNPIHLPPLPKFEPDIFEEMPHEMVLPSIDRVLTDEKIVESPLTALPPIKPEKQVLRRTTSSPAIGSLHSTRDPPRRQLSWATGTNIARKNFRLSSLTSILTPSLSPKRGAVIKSPVRGSLNCASNQDDDRAEAARELAIEAKREYLLRHARQKSFEKSIHKPLPRLPEEEDLIPNERSPKAEQPGYATKDSNVDGDRTQTTALINSNSALPTQPLECDHSSPSPEVATTTSTPKAAKNSRRPIPSLSSPSKAITRNTEPQTPSRSPTIPSRSPYRISPLRIRRRGSVAQSPTPRTPSKRASSTSSSFVPICIHQRYSYRECRCIITLLESCNCAVPHSCLDSRIEPLSSTSNDDGDDTSSVEEIRLEGETTIITYRHEFLDPICHVCLMDKTFGRGQWECEGDDGFTVQATPERRVRTIKVWSSPKKTRAKTGTEVEDREAEADRATLEKWRENLYRDYESDFGAVELDGRPMSIGQQIKAWF